MMLAWMRGLQLETILRALDPYFISISNCSHLLCWWFRVNPGCFHLFWIGFAYLRTYLRVYGHIERCTRGRIIEVCSLRIARSLRFVSIDYSPGIYTGNARISFMYDESHGAQGGRPSSRYCQGITPQQDTGAIERNGRYTKHQT